MLDRVGEGCYRNGWLLGCLLGNELNFRSLGGEWHQKILNCKK